MDVRYPRTIAVLIGVVAILAYLISTYHSIRPGGGGAQKIVVATGVEDGAYHQFAQRLSKTLPEVDIDIHVTEGSGQNIRKLVEGTADFIMIQSDIANYSYNATNGFERVKDFSALLPLFREYTQILVPRDSDIEILKDLGRKVVGIGGKGSGSRLHALDVLESIGLFPGADFTASNSNFDDGLVALENGDIDALFFTSAYRPQDSDSAFRHLAIPPHVIDRLVQDKVYYSSVVLASTDSRESLGREFLSVRAYLAVSTQVSDAIVRALLEALIVHWEDIRKLAPDLLELEDAIKREPVPFHPMTKELLIQRGYLEKPTNYTWIIVIGVIIFLGTLYARAKQSTYGRMGTAIKHRGLSWQRIVDDVAAASMFLIILSAFMIFLSVIVLLIQGVEADYARDMNIDNQFASISFTDALLWMFTFMASGFNAEDMFPASPTGRIIVALLALIGVAAPLGLVYTLVEYLRQRRLKIRSGEQAISHVRNHVLICGWNDKVPGLIYTITGDEAPEKKPVVVVAEIDEEYPLEGLGFDDRMVHYCRGDSADYSVLEKALASTADSAIVLAGNKKLSRRNLGSVLTSIALKKLNPDIFVANELYYGENKVYFESVGSKYVDSTLVANRLISICAFYPSIADFVLDALTHDDHSEIYSESMCVLANKLGLEGDSLDLWTLRERYLGWGVNVIGYAKGGNSERGVVDADFSSRNGMYPGFCDLEKFVEPEGVNAIFLADDAKSIRLVERDRNTGETIYEPGEMADIRIELPEFGDSKVLIAGPKQQAGQIQEQMFCLAPSLDISTLNPTTAMTYDGTRTSDYEGILSDTVVNSMPDIVILLTDDETGTRDGVVDGNSLDAKTIVRTRHIKDICGDRKVRVVAELFDTKNRQLLDDAGADVVVPGNLLTERVLAKLIYSKGAVSSFLIASLSVLDGVHLCEYNVKKGDLYCGLAWREVLNLRSRQFFVCGWYPLGKEKELENKEGDFRHHFHMIVDQSNGDQIIEPGDLLVLMVNRSA